MRKSALYTGSGDDGTTSLVGGLRVSKTHQRLETYGTIDELNSFIGLLITETENTGVIDLLQFVQHKLFVVGSYLATDSKQTKPQPATLHSPQGITPENIVQLEQGIDLLDSELPQMKVFILPGGCRAAALAHVCRTVCRRAERQLYRLKEDVSIEESVLIFINRLSDLLFVIARYECFRKNIEEICWI